MGTVRIRVAAEIGLTVALAAVLQLVAVWHLPQGGSYSLVMTPLFVLALLRGPLVGVTAGALYGVVDYFLDPYFVHPVQVLLDYPLAYAAVGLAGVLSGRWRRLSAAGHHGKAVSTAVVPGVAAGALGRYAAHVVSGLVFFTSAEVTFLAGLLFSLGYNAFVLVSAVASGVVSALVLPQVDRVSRGRS